MRGSKARQKRRGDSGQPLFQPVGHLNPGVVGAGEDGEGNHIFEEGNEEVNDPRRRANMPQQSQQVVPRRTVKGFLKVMEQQVVVLVGFNCGIETLVEEGDVLINGRARSGALGRIQELKYGWRNERVQDAGNEAVVGVTDRDRTEVGGGCSIYPSEKRTC